MSPRINLGKGMTPRERVTAALRREEFDVFPAANLTSVAVVEGMRRAGASYPAAHLDGDRIAALAAMGRDCMGFDTVAPYFSILLEAGALGSEIDWGDEIRFPYVKKNAFSKIDDVEIRRGYFESKEIQELLRAIRILKKRYGNKLAIVGKVMGPWSIACHVYGVGNLALDTILAPQKTKELFMELGEVPKRFAAAQFEAGADIVTFADHVTRDIVSASVYADLVESAHKDILRALKPMGPVALHVCGNVEDRIGLFAEAGFEYIHLDSRNDFANCRKACGDKLLIAGGVNNPVTLLCGRKHMIERDVDKCVESGVRLIGPECMIQPVIPISTLKYLADAVHRRRYREFV